MEYFEFNNLVKICAGNGAIESIKSELDYFKCNKPLILSGEVIKKSGTLKYVLKMLEKNFININYVWTEIPNDSSTLTVKYIAKYYNDNMCDSIIALGGGSVIDTAKGVKLLVSQNAETLFELCGNDNLNYKKKVPLIIIPTTCGTGSECTNVAVIKDEKSNEKIEFLTREVLPDVAILEPNVLKTIPLKILATSSIDSLTHAIESFICLQKNELSDIFSIYAIQLIEQNLLLSIHHQNKIEYKFELLKASTLSGLAFGNSMVGIVHAIGHSLGAYNISHGNAMAILLVECLKFNYDVCKNYYSKLLLYLKGAEYFVSIKEDNRPRMFIKGVEELIQNVCNECSIGLHLKDYNIKKSDFEDIANKTLCDGASILNRKKFTKKDILQILEKCY